jgi:hypothetical protein
VYSLASDQSSWIEQQVGVEATSITLYDFNPGITYTFKVKSRTAFDFSVGYSNEVDILAASSPEQPAAPTTTFDRTLQIVKVDWTAPTDNGSPITSYKVELRQSNLIYSEELVSCNGADAAIMAALSCSVPVDTLLQAPFSLQWGSNIYARIVAVNLYGESQVSEAGHEAQILTIPDKPVSLAEVVAMRSDNSITVSWEAGAQDGGAPVLDYRISYDQSIADWIVLSSGIT